MISSALGAVTTIAFTLAVLPDPVHAAGDDVLLLTAVGGALAVIWRKVLKPIVAAAKQTIDAYELLLGIDERFARVERRLEAGEGRFERIEASLHSVDKFVELARDEHVADIRTLIRRGEIPHPIVSDPDVPEEHRGIP